MPLHVSQTQEAQPEPPGLVDVGQPHQQIADQLVLLVELLNLRECDPTRRHLLSLFERQAAALKATQHDSGLWHTLLDHRGSDIEASATAGFAYGLLKGVRKRYLPADYAPVAERAIRAVIDTISPSGELQNVSFGTAMGSDLDYYRQIPRTSMPYGQAMAMLALAEYLRGYI